MQVYYETLCPDSQKFIREQLFPTYEKLGQYMKIEFIPFGWASVSKLIVIDSLMEKTMIRNIFQSKDLDEVYLKL